MASIDFLEPPTRCPAQTVAPCLALPGSDPPKYLKSTTSRRLRASSSSLAVAGPHVLRSGAPTRSRRAKHIHKRALAGACRRCHGLENATIAVVAWLAYNSSPIWHGRGDGGALPGPGFPPTSSPSDARETGRRTASSTTRSDNSTGTSPQRSRMRPGLDALAKVMRRSVRCKCKDFRD
jgi:hypothetical protein